MNRATSTRTPSRTLHARTTALGALVLFGLASVTLTLGGCQKSKKKQATEVIENAVKPCRTSDDTFYEVTLFNGDEKEVLQSTCSEEIGEVEMEDEFGGTAEVGPYTWKAGLQEGTGTWDLQDVTWRALDRARRTLDGNDLSADGYKRAADHLATAIEDYPSSEWLRMRHLEVLLKHRTAARDISKKSGVELGELLSKQLDSLVEWARDNEKPNLAARARFQVVSYYKSLAQEAERRRSNVPDADEETVEVEKLKGAIEASKKQGNDEEVEEYKQELERLRKERPKKKKHFADMVKRANTKRCAHLAKLSLSGIDDDDLRDDIDSAKRTTDCESLLSEEDGG